MDRSFTRQLTDVGCRPADDARGVGGVWDGHSRDELVLAADLELDPEGVFRGCADEGRGFVGDGCKERASQLVLAPFDLDRVDEYARRVVGEDQVAALTLGVSWTVSFRCREVLLAEHAQSGQGQMSGDDWVQRGLVECIDTRNGVLGPQAEVLQPDGFCHEIGDLVDGPHGIRVAVRAPVACSPRIGDDPPRVISHPVGCADQSPSTERV